MNKSILIKPVITEKSMSDANLGKFTFVVTKDSDKEKIKRAVEEQFNVHVVTVSTNIVKGKSIRTGKRRNIVKKSPFKKAVVKLATGEKIAVFDIGEGK